MYMYVAETGQLNKYHIILLQCCYIAEIVCWFTVKLVRFYCRITNAVLAHVHYTCVALVFMTISLKH